MEENMTVNLKSIFEYDDYRKLLGDLIENRKQKGLPCSFRWLSQQAGFSSPNFFKLVLDGSRDLSIESLRQVIRIFKLTTEEAEYFKLLVLFQKSRRPEEKVIWADRILKLRPEQESSFLQKSQFDYHRKWWYVVVRESLLLHQEVESAEQLKEILDWELSLQQIEEALQKLSDLELIQKNEGGHWTPTQKVLMSGDRIASSALFGFHQQILELAQKALLRYSSTEREFHALTVAMDADKYQQVREAIARFKKEILQITEASPKGDSIYQVNLQLFPVARAKKDKR